MSTNFYWDEFLIKGDALFDYMTQNFEKIMDETMIYCSIVDNRLRFWHELDELNEIYKDDIEKLFISWIKNEVETQELFQKTNWKPFRDLEAMVHMNLGYRKMFQYKQYYFQLMIDSDYYFSFDNLHDFIHNKEDENAHIFFVLALYGWKDDEHEKLQPDDDAVIPSDNIMPIWYWEIQ